MIILTLLLFPGDYTVSKSDSTPFRNEDITFSCGRSVFAETSTLFVQISQQITHIQAYIRTQERTRSYTEKYLHRTKWPIDRPTNTAADTATASAEDSTDAPDALVDAPE